MPYCMYLRKSRADLEAEARGEGETLARHLQTLTLLAARLNLDVPPDGIYREIVSGDTIAARPMMQRLLHEVQAGKWEGVLCTEVERLARGDTIDQGMVAQAFKYSNTKIITPAKTYDPSNEMDEEYFEFSLFMARREYKAITRRMQAGRAASVREGHYVGGKRPFGYEVVKCKGQKGYTLQQIPEEARIVRLMYDLYLYQGLGAAAIANRLNAMGSTSYDGHVWNACAIRQTLYQPVHAGYVQWLKRESKKTVTPEGYTVNRPFSDRYILAKGLHEPICTEEEFARVRELAISRRKICQVDNKHLANPLAGLCKCALCGYAMRRRPNVRGVFLCCITPTCSCSSTYLDEVVAVVLESLRRWVADYSGRVPSPQLPAAPDHSAEIQAAQSAISTAQRQLTAAQDMLERGVYSIDEYVSRRHLLKQKISQAESLIQSLQSAPTPADPEGDIIRILPQVRRVLAAWPFAATAAEQNALLRSVLSRIDYSKSGPLLRSDSARDNISIAIYPLHTP